MRYRVFFGEQLNWRRPTRFEEKLFWLSVNYRHPLIMHCADKYRVREYVMSCGCGDILNELYGVFEDCREIPWDRLPNQFVFKSNRGSGDNLFCLDKDSFDVTGAVALMENWPQHIYGVDTAEYQYARIPYKLICEKYLLDGTDSELIEYQFFCFNGVPRSILVRNDLETAGKHPFAVSYSIDWEREYLRKNEEKFAVDLPRPVNLDKMIEYATRLCAPFPHVRVDFYEVDGNLYFGELTFSTHGNVFSNYKVSTLEMWNKLLSLPPIYRKQDRY